jgi:hypothetical protein
MWALFSRRLRMWLIFSVVIPVVRAMWGRAQANRMARKAGPAGMADATRRPARSGTS